MSTEENPPYITAIEMFGVWHVNKMEYNSRSDDYMVTVSKGMGTDKGKALAEAIDWAKREGIEYRRSSK